MTSDVPPKATGGSVERVLGQVISLSGILLFALQDAQELDAKNPMALWWSALVWLVIGLVVVNAALGAVLPLGYLRFHWAATPALTAVVLVGSFAAYQGNDPDGLYLWTWSMGSVTLSYLALWARPVVAIGVGVAFGFLPVLGGVLVEGRAPERAADLTPIQITSAGFIVIFLAIRAHMTRLHEAEAHAKSQEERRVRSAAELAQQGRVARLVHDEVLATLSAALRFDGAPPAALKTQARQALAVFDGDEGSVPFSAIPALRVRLAHEAIGDAATCGGVVAALEELAVPLGGTVEVQVCRGLLSADVAGAVLGAAREAVRNCERHAEAAPSIRGEVSGQRVELTIRDRGRGFDPDAVDPARRGISGSIVGRMADLPGGAATVRSAPGEGTEVVLSWRT